MAAYQTLANLFGGWLHQDWKPEFGTVENALAQYAAAEGPDTVTAALAELEQLAQLNEAPLQARLERLGCYVSPSAMGLGAKAFLTDVVARGLRANAAAPKARKAAPAKRGVAKAKAVAHAKEKGVAKPAKKAARTPAARAK